VTEVLTTGGHAPVPRLLEEMRSAADIRRIPWPAFKEGSSSTLTILSARDLVRAENLTEAQRLVDHFVQRAKAEPWVEEIWVDWADFVVWVVSKTDDLDDELRLRAAFIDLASTLSEPGRGDLYVFADQPDSGTAELIYTR
jgi:hypothetical protein